MTNEDRSAAALPRVAAWTVHLFTASGAVFALLALIATTRQQWTLALLWLGAALVVDGIDGTLARAARVKAMAPRIDGDALDLVIDYISYVFVPSVFLLEAGLLPDAYALALAALIQLSSLYVFARRDMKTDDGYFRGFPALWNVVAFYLFAAEIGPDIAAIIVAGLVALTFAPIHFVHPFRVRDYGAWPAILAVAWAMASIALLLRQSLPEPIRPLLLGVSAATAAAIIAFGLLRSLRGMSRR